VKHGITREEIWNLISGKLIQDAEEHAVIAQKLMLSEARASEVVDFVEWLFDRYTIVKK
jgi:hypothetical protein